MIYKCKCPLCGKGMVEINSRDPKDADRKIAKKMRQAGYTIRQIMTTLGYKHPGSISHLLHNQSK